MIRTVKIFLDDVRQPKECLSYMYHRIGAENPIYDVEWLVVKNFEEFITAIQLHFEDITHVSFDHDLADGHYTGEMYKTESEYMESIKNCQEKTGYDCAVWMKEYYHRMQTRLPIMYVHSMNPAGTKRIIDLFKPKQV